LKKEVSKMEKVLLILAAMLMVLSLSMAGYASDQGTVGTMGTGHQARMERLAACGPGEMYTGDVVWTDPDIQRIMVNGRDGSKIFDVSGAVMKGEPEAQQLVVVKYTVTNGERIASSVNAVPQRLAALYVGLY